MQKYARQSGNSKRRSAHLGGGARMKLAHIIGDIENTEAQAERARKPQNQHCKTQSYRRLDEYHRHEPLLFPTSVFFALR
jgi:hypothetical protein